MVVSGLVVYVAPAEHSGKAIVVVLRTFGALERGVHQAVPAVVLLELQGALVVGYGGYLRAVGGSVAPGMLKRVVGERFLERSLYGLTGEDVGALFGVADAGGVHSGNLDIDESAVAACLECRGECKAGLCDAFIGLVAMIVCVVGEYLHFVGHLAVEGIAEPVGDRRFPCHGHLCGILGIACYLYSGKFFRAVDAYECLECS